MNPKEILEKVLEGCPKNITWYEQAVWAKENVAQSILEDSYVELYESLCKLEDQDGETADSYRDDLDVLWIAIKDQSNIEERVKDL